MKRRTLVLALFPLVGCASLIGASFDDAHPAGPDAGPDVVDAHDTLPDVALDVEPPFDPSSLPGLAFWIDATQGVDVDGSNAVTTWHDRSANHYDAVPAAQGTLPPKLVAGALAGKPVVHFSSVDLDLLRTTWVGPSSAELTMFVVARGYANSVLRFQSTVGNFPFLILPVDVVSDASSPSFRLDVGVTPPTYSDLLTFFDGGAAVVGMTWRADGTAATFLDGTLVEQRVVSSALPAGQTLFIGGALPLLAEPSTRVPFADGDVAEAIVYASALDENARRAVEGYLLDKWAIAP